MAENERRIPGGTIVGLVAEEVIAKEIEKAPETVAEETPETVAEEVKAKKTSPKKSK